MDRKEFIEKFRIALSGEVNHNIINENVNYYEDYIDMELQKGKSEGQIFTELGDPRLLAKTIIETNKIVGNGVQEEEYAESEANEANETPNRKVMRMPGWVIVIIVILVIGIVITTVTSVISFLLPVFIPILCVILIARFIQRVLH